MHFSALRRVCGVSGFSLLELLVATACTTMIAAAVFSLLVGAAATSRREWGALEARRTANVAVAALAADLARAGTGLEAADAVQRSGVRIDYASSPAPAALRVVLAHRAAIEISAHLAPSRYRVEPGGAPQVGDAVVGLGFAARPLGAPLPLGAVVAVAPRADGVEIQVAWRAAEVASVSAWGAPRALLPVVVREYDTRAAGGALQLGRRDDGGPRQPVADGLTGLWIDWLVDADGDGHADALQRGTWAGPASRRCAARVEASAQPVWTLGTARSQPDAPLETAVRWVTLAGC